MWLLQHSIIKTLRHYKTLDFSYEISFWSGLSHKKGSIKYLRYAEVFEDIVAKPQTSSPPIPKSLQSRVLSNTNFLKTLKCNMQFWQQPIALCQKLFFLLTFITILDVMSRNKVEGGHCWSRLNKKNRCTSLLRAHISREECCNGNNGALVAWSEDDLKSGDLFFWRALGGGVPNCFPCKTNCTGVICEKGRKCALRKGKPRCICAPNCSKRKHKQPICGTDGRTYRNYCSLMKRECRKNTKIFIDYSGRCKKTCAETKCSGRKRCVLDQNLRPHCVKCFRPCLHRRDRKPICGIDSVTYKSQCHLRQASCLQGKAITLAYPGRCKAKATCVSVRCGKGHRCLTELNTLRPRCTQCKFDCKRWGRDRVCGSDNRTYANWCQMKRKSCQTGIVIEPKSNGQCSRDEKDKPSITRT